jgi:hypothetical protein
MIKSEKGTTPASMMIIALIVGGTDSLIPHGRHNKNTKVKVKTPIVIDVEISTIESHIPNLELE